MYTLLIHFYIPFLTHFYLGIVLPQRAQVPLQQGWLGRYSCFLVISLVVLVLMLLLVFLV